MNYLQFIMNSLAYNAYAEVKRFIPQLHKPT